MEVNNNYPIKNAVSEIRHNLHTQKNEKRTESSKSFDKSQTDSVKADKSKKPSQNDLVISGEVRARQYGQTELLIKSEINTDGKSTDLQIDAEKKNEKPKQRDVTIKAAPAKDSNSAKPAASGENKNKSEKSTRQALEKFMQKNPTGWHSAEGEKVGRLEARPYNK